MSDFNTVPAAAHRLELVGRERLVVSGVEDVDRFDESGIVMSTTAASGLATGNMVTSIVMFAILALLAVLALVFNEKIFNALRAKKQRSGAKDSDDEASSPQE